MYFDEEDYRPVDPNNDFNQALNDLIHTEIEERLRQRVADYDRMHRDYTKQNKELTEARKEVRNLARQLEETKDISFNTGINFGLRKAFGGYKIGDDVYFVRSQYQSKNCPACDKQKKVEVEFNGVKTMVRCPECDGYGTKSSTIREVVLGQICEVKSTIWNRGNSEEVKLSAKVPRISDSFSLTPERAFKKHEEAASYLVKLDAEEKDRNEKKAKKAQAS